MIDFLHPLTFHQPWFLVFGLAAILVYAVARLGGGRMLFSSIEILPTKTSWRVRFDFLPDALLALAVIGIAVALAGPRLPDKTSKIRREGIAIMMAIDISSSMQAIDSIEPGLDKTRLEAVKEVFVDFVHGTSDNDALRGRPDDIIGLVTFAGFAETRCPLTLDHGSLTAIAKNLNIVERRSDDGTAVGDGLGLGVVRLSESKAASKVLILLTDGVNNTGIETPIGAATLAAEEGIKVYTIGVGSTGMAYVRGQNIFTGEPELRQERVQIDEATLQKIAEQTGGQYFRAADAGALRNIYAEIDKLERSKNEDTQFAKHHEYYWLALLLALGCALCGWLLRATELRRLP